MSYTIESSSKFSMKDLKRFYDIVPNKCVKGLLEWSRSGEIAGAVEIYINTFEDINKIRLRYKNINNQGKCELIDYTVSIIKTECYYGGYRYWFKCPNNSCNNKCSNLYQNTKYFLCRKCSNLLYEEQIESKQIRGYRIYDYEYKLKKLHQSIHKKTYKGKITRKQLNINILNMKILNCSEYICR